MDIHTLRRYVAARDAISVLETVNVTTGVRSVLQEFDHVSLRFVSAQARARIKRIKRIGYAAEQSIRSFS